MDNVSRTAILARVRQSQIRGFIPESPEGLPDRLVAKKPDPADLLFRLQEEFNLLGVKNFIEDSEEAVCNRVQNLIAGKPMLSWDLDQLPYGLGKRLENSLQNQIVYYGRDPKEDQAKAEIGLTGCEAVIAETGSLAMISEGGKPRTASLLPYVHVVVIRRADIVLSMDEFFEKFKTRELLPYLVFITGPSRTADIELSLTLGVHGPGEVIAVVGP